jgi:O-antigen/teichoic acid export membrane protein
MIVSRLSNAARSVFASIRSGERDAARWNALGVFIVRALSAVILFVTQIALARWMGASDYGVYVAAWTCVLVLGGLSSLGLSVTMMRLVPQYRASGAFDLLRGLLRGGRLLATGSAATIALVGGLGIYAVSLWSGSTGPSLPQLLALACLPAYALTDVQDGIGRGQGWTLEAIAPPYLLRPLLLLGFLAGAHAGGIESDAINGMTAALLATLGAAALQSALINRRVRESVPAGPAKYEMWSWLHISLPLLGAAGCELVMQNTDVLMLTAFRPSHEVGVYYASAKTTGLALFVQYAVGSAYAGRIAAASAVSNHADVREHVREAVRWTFIPSFAMTAIILLVGLPVLSQFGHDFTDAYPVMFILAVGVLARAAVGPSETILNMMGQQRACAASLATAAVVCLVMNFALIPTWGIYGASIATASALVTAASLNWYAARRLLGLDLFVLTNLRRKKEDDAPLASAITPAITPDAEDAELLGPADPARI